MMAGADRADGVDDGASHGAVVEFRNVSRHDDGVRAVADCNLRVEAGEFFTLLGHSGSGKTTLLNMLAGFTERSAGEILMDSVDVTASATERSNLGMVFQNYSLFPHMNVAQNVGFPLKMRHVARAEIQRKVGDALDLVGLGYFKDRMPNQLSGGQRSERRCLSDAQRREGCDSHGYCHHKYAHSGVPFLEGCCSRDGATCVTQSNQASGPSCMYFCSRAFDTSVRQTNQASDPSCMYFCSPAFGSARRLPDGRRAAGRSGTG